ncbi:uncharacterized protein LOC141705995 isoform X2 [Apium graveolens]|uniref:uncharacterized protein LOC141705995 isoform X2 n=1 Tax=Apium graveolens TaxID=4045 RepID=UPI003D78DADE
MQAQMSLNKKEELESKLDTGEKKPEKEETIACTSGDQPVQVENNEMQDQEKEVARPSLNYAYGRRDKALIFNMFSQLTSHHQFHLEKQQRDIQNSPATFTRGVKEITDKEPNTRWQTCWTSTENSHQQNVVVVDQPMPVEENLHNNNQLDSAVIDNEDDTSFRIDFDYFYARRKTKMRTSLEVYKQSKLDKGKRQAQASSIFSQVTSRHKARLEEQRRDIKISPATITRDIVITPVETVSSKTSPKKGCGRKSKALTGRPSRSVPRQRKRKSDIKEIEDGDLNNRRQTYFLGKNEKPPSIFDHSSKGFELVDTHIGYQESLLKFAKNLGPTAQSVASKKLQLLSLAQTTGHGFQAPVPQQPSSAWRLSEDPKGKSVIMERGCGRKSVSAEDMRPMRSFDSVGTLSAGSAYISSLPDTSRIQRSTDVFRRSVGENVHFPPHNHNQLVLQQHRLPPRNAAVLNANSVRPSYQIPTVYEPRRMQIASTPVRPSRLSRMFPASGSGNGVWGGHQSTPLNELQRHDSNSQLQNQHGLGAHQQQQMGFQQQPLPILSNLFDTGISSSVPNHQTTSNAGRSAQQLPLAQKSYTNLELQLRTKPLSPDEAS